MPSYSHAPLCDDAKHLVSGTSWGTFGSSYTRVAQFQDSFLCGIEHHEVHERHDDHRPEGPYCSDIGSCHVPGECDIRSQQCPPRICRQVKQVCRAGSDAGIGRTTLPLNTGLKKTTIVQGGPGLDRMEQLDSREAAGRMTRVLRLTREEAARVPCCTRCWSSVPSTNTRFGGRFP